MQLLESIKWYRAWKGGTWYKVYLKHPKTGKRVIIWDHNSEPVYFKIRYKVVKIEHYNISYYERLALKSSTPLTSSL